MAQFLCQICNRIVTCGENHTCLIFKNNNVHSLPLIQESNKTHKMYDDPKDKFTENSSDISGNLSTAVPLREQSEVSLMSASTKTGKYKDFFNKTSNNPGTRNMHDASFLDSTLNNENEDHSKINPSLKASLGIDEPIGTSGSKFREYHKRTLDDTGNVFVQKKSEPNISQKRSDISDEERDTSLEEGKCQSLKNDIDIFMYFLESVNKKGNSDNINTSTESNLIVSSDIPAENKEPGNNMIQKLVYERNSLSETDSQIKEIASNGNELKYSKKNANEEAGFFEMPGSEKGFSVDFCPMKFNQKINLDNKTEKLAAVEKSAAGPSGIRTHEKKIDFDVYPKKSSSRIIFKDLYNKGIADKSFVCGTCKRQFSQKAKLIRHCRIHTGEKPFVCNICKKAFAGKGNLTVHIRTHTGEKPYKCPKCEMAFTNSGDCKRHQMRVHK